MADGNVLTSLGINPLNLVGQMISFGILVYILQKFIYKPILKKLNDREKMIQKGIKAAEDNLSQREQIAQEQKKILAKTSKDAEKILQKTKEDANKIKEEIIEASKKEAEKIMAKRQVEMNEEFEKQRKVLRNEAVGLSAQIAKKVIKGYLDEKSQTEIIDNQLKKLAQVQIKQ
jgi:F-type H+-transporting ATPase subunit b